MFYLFGIIILGYILWVSISELVYEIKHKKLFKREKFIWGGRVGHEMGLTGQEGKSWGCGTYFLVFIIIGIIFFVLIRM